MPSLKRQVANLGDWVAHLNERLEGAERVLADLLAEREQPAPAKKTTEK